MPFFVPHTYMTMACMQNISEGHDDLFTTHLISTVFIEYINAKNANPFKKQQKSLPNNSLLLLQHYFNDSDLKNPHKISLNYSVQDQLVTCLLGKNKLTSLKK